MKVGREVQARVGARRPAARAPCCRLQLLRRDAFLCVEKHMRVRVARRYDGERAPFAGVGAQEARMTSSSRSVRPHRDDRSEDRSSPLVDPIPLVSVASPVFVGREAGAPLRRGAAPGAAGPERVVAVAVVIRPGMALPRESGPPRRRALSPRSPPSRGDLGNGSIRSVLRTPRRTLAIMMSAAAKSSQAIHSRPSSRRSTWPSQRPLERPLRPQVFGLAVRLPKDAAEAMEHDHLVLRPAASTGRRRMPRARSPRSASLASEGRPGQVEHPVRPAQARKVGALESLNDR